MKIKLIIAATLLSVLTIASADAQIIRNKSERVRIHSGVRSGEVTRPEAYRLHKERQHIRRDIHRARRDGHVNRAERMHIRHEKRKHSRHIYKAKHNGRKRF